MTEHTSLKLTKKGMSGRSITKVLATGVSFGNMKVTKILADSAGNIKVELKNTQGYDFEWHPAECRLTRKGEHANLSGLPDDFVSIWQTELRNVKH